MLSTSFKRNAKLVLDMAMGIEVSSVFVEFSPHTKQVRVYAYTDGWSPDTNADTNFTVYDDSDFGNTFDEIFDYLESLK